MSSKDTDPHASTVSSEAGPSRLVSTDLPVGTMVGEYRIEGKLGQGGMGHVFAGVHPLIGKRAAVKVLRADLCTNPEAVERFVQEARSVNQIGHPNIVDVFSFGTLPDGRSYLVMEWLKGESLAGRLQRSMTLEEAAEILEPICAALETAHGKGIVHRDLKPDNVFLVEVPDARPLVKLLDFGIAKLMGNDETRIERTRTGNLLGTPAYISPEQARGKAVDQRTDVYSLGAMMYEMVSGQRPFDADSAMDVISMHLHETPEPPSKHRADVPEAVDQLILAMLAKKPDERPSLKEVRALLAEIKGGAGTINWAARSVALRSAAVAREPARGSGRRWIVAVLAVAVLGGGAFAIYKMRGPSPQGTPPGASATPPSAPPGPSATPTSATPPSTTPPTATPPSDQPAAPATADRGKAAGGAPDAAVEEAGGTEDDRRSDHRRDRRRDRDRDRRRRDRDDVSTSRDTKPADTAPADTAPADTKPTDPKPTDTKPAVDDDDAPVNPFPKSGSK